MTHLVTTITHHGLGHFAQTAPVLNALRRKLPGLELTLVTTIPEHRVRERIEGDFRLVCRRLDFGFVMRDALRIDMASSARAYREFHANWDERVAEEAAWLAVQRPDLLLANVAYLPLAAAARLGIPAWGMSSLNWADLFAHAFRGHAWSHGIHQQMLGAYRSARGFIKLTPAMDMPDLPDARTVGPVARLGGKRRTELLGLLGAAFRDKVIAVMFGGVEKRLPMECWRLPDDMHWLVPEAWQFRHPRARALESLGWDFTDIIASVDALIGKPGYGTFVEAACNGTPMLYALRSDWPEQAVLLDWFDRNGCGMAVSEADLERGRLTQHLEQLWMRSRPGPPRACGAGQAADLLAHYLLNNA